MADLVERIPQAIDVEICVLGALILEAASLERGLGLLQRDHFYKEGHRIIYDHVVRLRDAGQPVDIITLSQSLTDADELEEVGGRSTLLGFIEVAATTAQLEAYVGILRELAAKREFIKLGMELLHGAQNGTSATELDQKARQRLESVMDPIGRAAGHGEPPTKALSGPGIFSVHIVGTDWLVRDVFSIAHQHMITGASQSSKSWIAGDVSIAVAHPEIPTVLGQPVCRHGRVCFESWEMGQAEDVRRLQKGIRGHGLMTASEDLILLSDTRPTLSDEAYFIRRRRELNDWGVILYVIDSLSQAAGMELNDNTAYTAWWRARIKPLLDDGITVIWTHLRGHAKPGVPQDRDSASRGATQIRALSTGVLEVRQLSDVLFTLKHNKHRDGIAVPFGTLTLEGGIDDPFVRLVVRADGAGQEGKAALARLALRALGQAQAAAGAEPLTRKAIEQALNAPTKPRAERVSRKTYEAVLAQMVADDLFLPGKRGNAETWAWIGAITDDETDIEVTDDAE